MNRPAISNPEALYPHSLATLRTAGNDLTGKLPPMITIRHAATAGSILGARLVGRTWTASLTDYLDWLDGWPHRAGRKPNPTTRKEG